jgi:hypothetical protein
MEKDETIGEQRAARALTAGIDAFCLSGRGARGAAVSQLHLGIPLPELNIDQ